MSRRHLVPVAPEVDRAADGSPVRLRLTAPRPRAAVPPPPAGAKRLALLRWAVVTAGMQGTRVLQAVCMDELAGTRLADGTLQLSARMADILIELMANLPVALAPTDPEGAK